MPEKRSFLSSNWWRSVWLSYVVGLVIAWIIAAIAFSNGRECSDRRCDAGAPVLMKGMCVCVQEAKK